MTLVRLGFSIALALAALTPEQAAHGCEGVVLIKLSRNRAVSLIRNAEVALAAGKAERTLSLLRRALDGADDFDIEDPKLKAKLERVRAVAAIRAGDASEVENAIREFRVGLTGAPENPWLKTRLAEGLSRTKEGRKEAKEILEKLAQQDLIADAEGFATLARLRRLDGDVPGAVRWLERCKAVATRPPVCSSAELPPPPIPIPPPSSSLAPRRKCNSGPRPMSESPESIL